jgi:hypothetical protein
MKKSFVVLLVLILALILLSGSGLSAQNNHRNNSIKKYRQSL